MLHATLAIEAPDHHYWQLEGYAPEHLAGFRRHSAIYLAPGAAEPLFEELDAARFDERKGGDPTMNQPETTLDMMDDAIDALRYIIRASGGLYIRQTHNIEVTA